MSSNEHGPTSQHASPQIEIRALLALALDEKPPENLPDRVMARLALLTTVLEFGRLLAAAPFDWVNKKEEEGDDGNGHD